MKATKIGSKPAATKMPKGSAISAAIGKTAKNVAGKAGGGKSQIGKPMKMKGC